MAKAKFKVFGVRYFINARKHCRAVVATTSLTSAARLIGIHRSEMQNYGSETHNEAEVAQAMRHPGLQRR